MFSGLLLGLLVPEGDRLLRIPESAEVVVEPPIDSDHVRGVATALALVDFGPVFPFFHSSTQRACLLAGDDSPEAEHFFSAAALEEGSLPSQEERRVWPEYRSELHLRPELRSVINTHAMLATLFGRAMVHSCPSLFGHLGFFEGARAKVSLFFFPLSKDGKKIRRNYN